MNKNVSKTFLSDDARQVIAHIIYRLQVGGLENGLVNLINNMPKEKYRHVIICIKEYTDFKDRITADDVELYALNKKDGNDLGVHVRLWKLLRKIRPTIIHTRNIGTIEYSIVAKLAGVKYCVHGEHGRDMKDIDGSNNKYIYLRRMLSPFINNFIALSKDLQYWLIEKVRIPDDKIIQLYNGVDTKKFFPAIDKNLSATNDCSAASNDFCIGTIGRFSEEKDQITLVKAFLLLLVKYDLSGINIKLTLIGDGPLKEKLVRLLEDSSASKKTFMPGECNDIPAQLRGFDVFVLPSLGEGISNTILEAMSTGLPVIATNVGGNPELIQDNETGFLVEPNNPSDMAEKLYFYIKNPDLLVEHGKNSRDRVLNMFGIDNMVDNYLRVYDSLTMVQK
jgi:sugar transferase (PEP-CTERM/EpsH1 system associated)